MREMRITANVLRDLFEEEESERGTRRRRRIRGGGISSDKVA